MIYVYVDGRRMEYVRKHLNAQKFVNMHVIKRGDSIVLPLHWCLKTKEIDLKNLEGVKVFIPFNDNIFNSKITIYPYMKDKTVVNENAKLTALGIINKLSDKGISLIDLNVDIIGYGKCAKALGNLFQYMNIKYRYIYYKNIENITMVNDYKDKGNLIINTAPTCILDVNDKSLCNVDYIVDISSEKCMKKLQGKIASQIIFPGSLPEIYYASTSAKLIADYIRRVLDEE